MVMRGLLNGDGKNRAQLSLEFLLVYSVVLIVFLVIFAMVVSQRAATLSTQDYSTMQLMAQTVASEIDTALSSGSGYSATVQLPPGVGTLSYNISVSSSGVVTASTKVGKEVVSAQAYSSARNLVINGTVIAQGNGISVYQIPAYRGSVYVANSGGMIYLDEQPASTLSLAGNLNVGIGFNGESAGFNGRNSYIYSTLPTTKTTNVTIVVWVYVPSIFDHGAFVKIGGNTTGYGGYGIGVGGTNWDNAGNELWGLYENVRWIDSGRTIGTGWHDIVFEVNSSGVPNFYLDGKFIVAVTGTGPIAPGTIVTIGSDYPASGTRYFNGSIANVQVYNTSLSSLKIQQLYNEGIGGVPISNASLIGWWPLNGNANDYSGYGDHGAPRNVSFYGTAQIDAHVSNQNGGNAVGDIVGFTSTAGSFGSQGGEYATYTDAKGNATAILTANTSSTQLANITVTAFNGNYTIAGNVVGWWPLNIGSGNITYDLSTHNNNGVFVNNAWSTANNRTSFLTGNFNGASSYISIPQLSFSTGSFTLAFWANPKASQGCPSVFSAANSSYSFDIYAGENGSCGGNNAVRVFWSNAGGLHYGTNASVAHSWHFFVVTGHGTSLTAYIDGKKVATGSSSVFMTKLSYIGMWQGGGEYYPGLLSNLQLYNMSLSASQIQQLYKEGINGVPISNANLASWWPLDGNANDYSGNNNNGTSANVVYTNTNYNITTNYPVASFNGQGAGIYSGDIGSYINTTNSTKLKPTHMTVSAWIEANSKTPWMFVAGVQATSNWGSYYMSMPSGNAGIIIFGTFNNTNHVFVASSPLQLNKWYYVVGTYNGTRVSIYKNGVLSASAPDTQTVYYTPSGIFRIGNLAGFDDWNGSIADVQLYNTSLSSSQIQQLYQEGLPQYKKITIELWG